MLLVLDIIIFKYYFLYLTVYYRGQINLDCFLILLLLIDLFILYDILINININIMNNYYKNINFLCSHIYSKVFLTLLVPNKTILIINLILF